MRIGYARVSTDDQSLDLQLDALAEAGCDRVFQDLGVSGMEAERDGLGEALQALSPGDTLVVWRLDRLGRSVFDLIDTLHWMQARDVAFFSICDGLNTGSVFGETIYIVASAFAHLERCYIIERTRAGIAAAKARGVQFGRRPVLDGETFREALFLRSEGMSVPDIAAHLGVGRSTLYRYLASIAETQGSAMTRALLVH